MGPDPLHSDEAEKHAGSPPCEPERMGTVVVTPSPLTLNDMDAIVGGWHTDSFAVLGPHFAASEESELAAWEVRAFLPQATQAAVVIRSHAYPMTRRHEGGFFVAVLEGDPAPYVLRVVHDGSAFDIEDPYRFPPQLSSFDLHLHGEGTHFESYRTLGAHLTTSESVEGVRFAVWAPNAENVSVVGDFNQWDERRHPMRKRDGGIWEFFLPEAVEGLHYKYAVRAKLGFVQQKCDPYAFRTEIPPRSASIVFDWTGYDWQDAEWIAKRAKTNYQTEAVSIYEVHLESWLRGPDNLPLTYLEMADRLVEYVVHQGYTHLEMLPVAEHPFSGSWGYQVTGYYAPTARFGTPNDFRYLVDKAHQAGIGILIDWVPAHFPKDIWALATFDGTACYEHADPRQGEHRDWGTLIFNFGRNEVKEFLISNALFWIKHYHVDGLRVDAVASMLYLDYSREPGDWIPNQYGGRENIAAIEFIKKFNELVHRHAGVVTIAEESTSWQGTTRPVYLNGLGFTMKWNMGWMHDMFDYFRQDPVYRKFHQNNITFSMLYAFTENFVLPVSHDEVVHLKRSLLGKMPGDEWQRFANTRTFLAYMWGHPGKKLLFMGQDFGQPDEWNNEVSLPWHLLDYDYHRKLQDFVKQLNHLYRSQPAMYQVDSSFTGFEWIDFRDSEESVISFLRFAADRKDYLVFVCNFTPVVRHVYGIGVPEFGPYDEIFNSDWSGFGGSNVGNYGGVEAEPISLHNRPARIHVTLPPLAVIVLKPRRAPALCEPAESEAIAEPAADEAAEPETI